MSGSKINFDGLHKLAQSAADLGGTNDVPIKDLLTSTFIRSCSSFTSFEEMVEKSPFHVHSAEDFKAIPDAEWNAYVQANTAFPSWQEMIKSASAKWIKAKLFRGL